MCMVGMRVYVPNGSKEDDRGKYDGWSDKFDEKIPLYSPRIQKYMTLSSKSNLDDEELDETLDDVIKPQEGHSRVWAVPRPRKCVSEEYIRLINIFCEKGGLNLILEILEKEEFSEKLNDYNLCVMAILINLVSLPGIIYHKQVISDFCERLINTTKKRLLEAPDKALREVRKEHIEAIVKAIDTLNRRIVSREERIKQNDILKLDVALLCLKSSFMARRIQGIKDLNSVIKSHRAFSNRFSGEFLINWMFENKIFDVLFDPKGTHA